jgi:hypothetical protein
MSFYRMQRGWFDKPVFDREPYCRRAAWVWLIENAAFAPHNGLERGQLRASNRFLAEAWSWSESKVRRWLLAAEEATMIRRVTVSGKNLITLCNYGKYQLPIHVADAPSDEHPTSTRRVADANYKEGKKEIKEDSEAIASAANAAPPPEFDPVKDLWDRGLAVLAHGGIADRQARSIIGKWRKAYGDVAVLDAIVRAEIEFPSDPVAFMAGCMRATKSENGHGRKQSPGEKLFEGAWRAAEAFEARQRAGGAADEPLLGSG